MFSLPKVMQAGKKNLMKVVRILGGYGCLARADQRGNYQKK
jgi:hypothetical protein